MLKVTKKIVAYITHGSKLLVFRHPDYPEAGIQVPAGSVEVGESIRDAVLREAWEETGLNNLILFEHLGHVKFDMRHYGKNEIQNRNFFHLLCQTNPSSLWQHMEVCPSDGTQEQIVFEFNWVSFPNEVPKLAAGQGDLLEQLKSVS